MHGFARLRLVGTTPLDGAPEECTTDDLPQPLPFPSCFGKLQGGHAALDALDEVTLSFEKLARALEALDGSDDDGPRAA